jgi:hypothetical protein
MYYIVRNSYPVLMKAAVVAVKHCRLYIMICLFTGWCRVSEHVTIAWIKFDVCRALYTVYKLKVMQQSLLGVPSSKFYDDKTKSNDATF